MPMVKACNLSDLQSNRPFKVQFGGESVLLVLVEGAPQAVSAACLHRGGDLSQGELAGEVITCPLHGWRFDVRDGHCLQVPSAKLRKFEVKVENDDILVEI